VFTLPTRKHPRREGNRSAGHLKRYLRVEDTEELATAVNTNDDDVLQMDGLGLDLEEQTGVEDNECF
jgi:hypothetical protein